MNKAKQKSDVFQRSNIPLYIQVASTLRRRIEQGRWKLGDKISSIPELEAEFGVARITIRQAVDNLTSEGLLSAKQGKGTYVTKEPEETRWMTLEIGLSSLLQTIEDNVPKFLKVENPPSPRLGPRGGELADEYVFLRSVQLKNNSPYGLVNVHIAKSVYDMSPEDFKTRTALAVLTELPDIKIGQAHQTLIISAAEMETAHLLKVDVNTSTAEVRCVVRDDQNIAVYIAEIIYRGDCIRFDIELL